MLRKDTTYRHDISFSADSLEQDHGVFDDRLAVVDNRLPSRAPSNKSVGINFNIDTRQNIGL